MEVRRIHRSWAGLRTFAPDEQPVIGPDPDEPSFHWLAGQGGNGVMGGPALNPTRQRSEVLRSVQESAGFSARCARCASTTRRASAVSGGIRPSGGSMTSDVRPVDVVPPSSQKLL